MKGWASMDTAPKDGTRFLFYNGKIVGIGFFINGKHFAADSFAGQSSLPPIQWLPLPEPGEAS